MLWMNGRAPGLVWILFLAAGLMSCGHGHVGGDDTTEPLSAISRVSVDSGGVESNGDSADPSISSDGRYVAFNSGATNLVSGDTNGLTDVFRAPNE